MSLGGIIILVLFAYIVYIKAIRPIVIRAKYKTDNQGVPIPEGFTPLTLMEHLKEKGFAYPEMKNIRINEREQVVIEGKFSSHPIRIEESKLFVERGERGSENKQVNCILEAVQISNHLNKFFNPNAPLDAYVEFNQFRKRRKQPLLVSTILVVGMIIAFIAGGGDEIVKDAGTGITSSNISSSYLPDYSSEITIGEAFNNFFGEPKWKSYEQGIQKYVDFQGRVTFNNEPATAVITFAILGEKFQVEAVKIDNQPLNAIEIDEFFKTVYRN